MYWSWSLSTRRSLQYGTGLLPNAQQRQSQPSLQSLPDPDPAASPEDPKPVAKTEAPTQSAPQRPVSAVGAGSHGSGWATPPPAMIQPIKQQLQQQLNTNQEHRLTASSQMNTSIRRPVPSGPAKTLYQVGIEQWPQSNASSYVHLSQTKHLLLNQRCCVTSPIGVIFQQQQDRQLPAATSCSTLSVALSAWFLLRRLPARRVGTL